MFLRTTQQGRHKTRGSDSDCESGLISFRSSRADAKVAVFVFDVYSAWQWGFCKYRRARLFAFIICHLLFVFIICHLLFVSLMSSSLCAWAKARQLEWYLSAWQEIVIVSDLTWWASDNNDKHRLSLTRSLPRLLLPTVSWQRRCLAGWERWREWNP